MLNIKKSIFFKFNKFFKIRYDKEINLLEVEADLAARIKDYQYITNKAARKHLNMMILPAISIFDSLISMGFAEDKALSCIEEYVRSYYRSYADFCKLAGKLPCFFGLFRKYFPLAMKTYPAEFWKTQWLKNDKDEIAFNMRECLYYSTFKACRREKLGPIFCRVDHLCYDNMSRKVRFVRTKTIAGGQDICDFRFVRSK